jgi:hypothetical protein
MRAISSGLHLGDVSAFTLATVVRRMRTNAWAVAVRELAGLAVTSTICTRPSRS